MWSQSRFVVVSYVSSRISPRRCCDIHLGSGPILTLRHARRAACRQLLSALSHSPLIQPRSTARQISNSRTAGSSSLRGALKMPENGKGHTLIPLAGTTAVCERYRSMEGGCPVCREGSDRKRSEGVPARHARQHAIQSKRLVLQLIFSPLYHGYTPPIRLSS